LTEYTGRTVDAVKVGTIKRAKGLEFKQVVVARVGAGLLRAGSSSSASSSPSPSSFAESEAEREARTLALRELYVGMTRARDGLWVGVR
jgi:superfamily I DNA/RNA helicase